MTSFLEKLLFIGSFFIVHAHMQSIEYMSPCFDDVCMLIQYLKYLK